jgi:hypothetical protein
VKRATTIVVLVLAATSHCFPQTDVVRATDKQIGQIDSDKGLTKKKFNVEEVYGKAFDGGGKLDGYVKNGQLVKIDQSIGLSYGLVTTIIYLRNGLPIKIIEREENYQVKDDQSGLDYTKLHLVFEATIYVVNWDKDDSQIVRKGARKFSEGTCSNFDYEPLIDRVKKLMTGD